jgi:hypothetical protein
VSAIRRDSTDWHPAAKPLLLELERAARREVERFLRPEREIAWNPWQKSEETENE